MPLQPSIWHLRSLSRRPWPTQRTAGLSFDTGYGPDDFRLALVRFAWPILLVARQRTGIYENREVGGRPTRPKRLPGRVTQHA